MKQFALQYRGDILARRRWHIEWLTADLKRRATDLGWDGSASLSFFDADGCLLGGFVP